jgi:hypothetical protein
MVYLWENDFGKEDEMHASNGGLLRRRLDGSGRHAGHAHIWAGALSRRQFVRAAAGATAAGAMVGSGLLTPPPPVLARDEGSTVPPNPIPFGDNGTHHFLPGRGKEVTTITDFVGFVGIAQLIGTGTGTNTNTGATTSLNWSIDNRFIMGTYVGVDGQEHKGTFGVF